MQCVEIRKRDHHHAYIYAAAGALLFLLGGVILQLAFQYNYVTELGCLGQQYCIRPASVCHFCSTLKNSLSFAVSFTLSRWEDDRR